MPVRQPESHCLRFTDSNRNISAGCVDPFVYVGDWRCTAGIAGLAISAVGSNDTGYSDEPQKEEGPMHHRVGYLHLTAAKCAAALGLAECPAGSLWQRPNPGPRGTDRHYGAQIASVHRESPPFLASVRLQH